jgi:hypothetical protein
MALGPRLPSSLGTNNHDHRLPQLDLCSSTMKKKCSLIKTDNINLLQVVHGHGICLQLPLPFYRA